MVLSSFVPVALLLSRMINKYKISFVSVAVFYFVLNFTSYGLFDNQGWMMSSGWNLPGVEKAARVIAGDVNREKFNVAMVVDAQNQGIPLRYFLTNWGKAPLSYENYVGADLLYVVTEPGIDLSKMKMWEITSFGPFQIEKNWSIQNDYLLYRLSHKSV